jgi:hypothetical protein
MVIVLKMLALESGTAYRVLSYSKHMIDYALPIMLLKLEVKDVKTRRSSWPAPNASRFSKLPN